MPPPDNDWSMYGYGGSKTPDTLIAEPRKHARRENMRKEYAENSDFPDTLSIEARKGFNDIKSSGAVLVRYLQNVFVRFFL